MTEQFEDLGFAKVDHARKSRNGFAEVVFCEGKTPEQAAQIAISILDHGDNLLATRADLEHFEAIQAIAPDAAYSARARVITVRRYPVGYMGDVAVVSAGTADQPVAEEAALTAEALGCQVTRYSDVGVAGLHRLLAVIDDIRKADVIIAVAGYGRCSGQCAGRPGGQACPGGSVGHRLWCQFGRRNDLAGHGQFLCQRSGGPQYRQWLWCRIHGCDHLPSDRSARPCRTGSQRP